MQSINIRYKIHKELSRSLLSTVYKVEDDDGNIFVIKHMEISSEQMMNLDEKKLYLVRREFELGQCLSRLNPDNIVQIYSLDIKDNNVDMKFEYCDQGDLKNYLLNNQLDYYQKLDIIYQIVLGYQTLYSVNVIHRDVKLENILVKTGKVTGQILYKISDFGLSKYGKNVTIQGRGNISYKPLEIYDDNDMTCDSEVYSFGLLFLCIFIGSEDFLVKKDFQLNGSRSNGFKFVTEEKLEELFNQRQIQNSQFVNTNLFKLLKAMLKINPNQRIKWKLIFEMFQEGSNIENNKIFNTILEKYQKSIEYAKINAETGLKKQFQTNIIERILNPCLNSLIVYTDEKRLEQLFQNFYQKDNKLDFFSTLHLQIIIVKLDFLERLKHLYLSANSIEQGSKYLQNQSDLQIYKELRQVVDIQYIKFKNEIEKYFNFYKSQIKNLLNSENQEQKNEIELTLKSIEECLSGAAYFCSTSYAQQLRNSLNWFTKNYYIHNLNQQDTMTIIVIAIFSMNINTLVQDLQNYDSIVISELRELFFKQNNQSQLRIFLSQKLSSLDIQPEQFLDNKK